MTEIVDAMDTNTLRGVSMLFINMPLRESAKPNNAPLGPALLASRLRNYGADVTILDLNAYRIKDATAMAADKPNGRWITYEETRSLLERHIGKHGRPDIIGLSGMITTLRWQEFVARTCRDFVPDTFLISGGGLATEIRSGLINWIPELDAVVHSEGDDVLMVLAKDVLEAKVHKDVGMAHLPECLGTLHGKPRFLYGGARPKNLNDLPFAAWDLLHSDVDGNPILEWYIGVPIWGLAANNSSATPFQMKKSMNTVSSRGCPFGCHFCFRGAQGERQYGMRAPANLVREAKWLRKEYKIDFLGFPDDNFAVDKKRIAELPGAFEALGGLRWGTHTRLDESDERVFQMAEAGCIYIGFGAESASAYVLEQMGKGGFILRPKGSKENQLTRINGFDFPTTMVEGIKNCRQAGVHGNCTWIMTYPGEELEHLKTSVAFIRWQVECATAGLAPGTPEYANAEASINQKMFVATAYPGTAMCKSPKVMNILRSHFGLSFDEFTNPIADDALRTYVLELDDATKVMQDPAGRPLNFGEMSDDQFLEAREHVDKDEIWKILDMK